jgi:hypothetical protein
MCDNKVSYYVPKGYDYREITVKCGLTDPYGSPATCATCASDPVVLRDIQNREENIAWDEWVLRMQSSDV